MSAAGRTLLQRADHADRTARQAVEDLLRDAPTDVSRDALLLTSELVSNAIQHTTGIAASPCTVARTVRACESNPNGKDDVGRVALVTADGSTPSTVAV